MSLCQLALTMAMRAVAKAAWVACEDWEGVKV
jgi:hypothetical protein